MRKKHPPLFTSKGEWSTLLVYPKRAEGSVGVAIPRALMRLSTSRNRLRRQIREAIRIEPEGQRLHQDLVIRVKKGGLSPSFTTIQKEMRGHLKRLRSSE